MENTSCKLGQVVKCITVTHQMMAGQPNARIKTGLKLCLWLASEVLVAIMSNID